MRTARERAALCIAVISSVVALGLAIGPNWNGRYDPATAVLTATLVAIIWYTFFTFQAVHKVDPVWIVVGIETRSEQLGDRTYATISNPSEHVVEVRFLLRAWTDGHLYLENPLGTTDDEFFTLGPNGSFGMKPYLPPSHGRVDPKEGRAERLYKVLLVELSAEWKDDVGRSGTTTPRYWMQGEQYSILTEIVSPSRIRSLQKCEAALE